MELNKNYFKRLLYYLDNIPSKYIIFFIDDMFLKTYPDTDNLSNLINLMKSNNNIIYSKLSHNSELYSKNLYEYNNYYYKIGDNINDNYLINLQPSIFEKKFFIEYINYCLNIKNNYQENSQLEIFAGGITKDTNFFINKDNYICLRPEKEIISIYDCGGIVAAGILHIDKVILEKNNIYIKVYKNNMIYEINENILMKLGEQNKYKLYVNNII
jgi:hypothetical protein